MQVLVRQPANQLQCVQASSHLLALPATVSERTFSHALSVAD